MNICTNLKEEGFAQITVSLTIMYPSVLVTVLYGN